MAKMAESHPPGEDDTLYFADNLEQDGKCALVFSSVWEWLIIREVNFTLRLHFDGLRDSVLSAR